MMYHVLRFLAWLWFKVCYRLRTTGIEDMPRTGGLLVASNHCSFFDPMAIGATAPRRITFLARASLSRNWLYRTLTRGIPIVPVDRGGFDREALRGVRGALEQGGACLVFPEGTRSDDGRLGEFKGGVALLAQSARVPVLPVHVAGTFEAWPRRRRLPRPFGRIRVHYGRPLDVTGLEREEALERLRAALLDLGAVNARGAPEARAKQPAGP